MAAREIRESLGRQISDQGRAQRTLLIAVTTVMILVAAVAVSTFVLARRSEPEPTPAAIVAARPPVPTHALARAPKPSAPVAAAAAPSLAKLELTFGGEGTGPGKFDRSHNLALDRDGNVYVVDRTNRVQKFDGSGKLLATFNVETKNQPVGPLSSDIGYGIGIAVDSKRRLYVSIGYDIIVLDAQNGKLLRKFPGSRNTICYNQLSLDQVDNVYAVSHCSDSHRNAIVKLSPAGRVLLRLQELPSYELATTGKLALDGSGKIYAPHGYEFEIRVLTPKGEVFTRMGRRGDGPCEFTSPGLDPVVVDSRGRIYAREFGHVHIFDVTGKCLGRFDTRDSGNAIDLAVGPDDSLYALTGTELVAKYSIHGS